MSRRHASRGASTERPSRARRHSVGRRALGVSLGISLSFFLLSSAALYLTEARRRTASIEGEIRLIYETQGSGIVEALWDYDLELLKVLADGLCIYPYINYAQVSDTRGPIVESGSRMGKSLERRFALARQSAAGKEETLGSLLVEVNSERIASDALRQVLVSASLQILLLALGSLIVLALFSRMVTRHLSRIAAYVGEYQLRTDAPELKLDKREIGDELDILVGSLNSMRRNLEAAYGAELRAMEELKLSEERNRVLVEEAPDAILIFDCDRGRFVSCNRRAETLFGRSREELLRVRPAELYAAEQPDGLPPEESIAAHTAQALAGSPVFARRAVRLPGGEILACELRITILPPAERKILRVSYLDITDRVRAEESVARSLREKEVLLQEVYHRTKNNMQLIASFLSLEAAAEGEGRVAATYNEMIGRIASMALVHQKLYESRDLSNIVLADYTADLLRDIRQAHLLHRPGIEIELRADPGISVLLDAAVPCGLVLNELIVNALKHAFPGGRGGRISVGLERGEPGKIVLSVSDDGVGLPPGFDVRRDGRIGLQTALTLVEGQLRGFLSVASGEGTAFTATIRVDVYSARV